MNKKAVTLLEILISSIILAITIGGLVSVFLTGKQFTAHTRSRMAGGELGKAFLDPLQMDVRADKWSEKCLGGNSSACPTQLHDSSQDITYHSNYTISPVAGTDLRRVKLDINWNEK